MRSRSKAGAPGRRRARTPRPAGTLARPPAPERPPPHGCANESPTMRYSAAALWTRWYVTRPGPNAASGSRHDGAQNRGATEDRRIQADRPWRPGSPVVPGKRQEATGIARMHPAKNPHTIVGAALMVFSAADLTRRSLRNWCSSLSGVRARLGHDSG